MKIDSSLVCKYQESASEIIQIFCEHWAHGATELQEIALILLADDYRDPKTIKGSQQLYRSAKDHLLVQCSTSQFLIGPLFRSGGSPCPSCLAHRIEARAFARHTTTLLAHAPDRIGSASTPSANADICALANTGANYVARQSASILLGSILEFCVDKAATRVHRLFAAPLCDCQPHIREDRRDRRERERITDGGEIGKEEELLSELESDVVGIVGKITLTKITKDLHVSVGSVSHPQRRSVVPLLAEGRGTTSRLARLSCLGEAAERYSCIFHGTEERITSSYLAVQDAAVHPNMLTLYSTDQYASKADPGLYLEAVATVPERFDESAEIEWTEARCLDGLGMRLVPTSYCFLGHQKLDDVQFCISDTNGCAAGRTINEALVKGLLELIERDACAIWWYNKMRRPEVDLSSSSGDRLSLWKAFFEYKQRSLSVLDISTDLGVAVCAAVSADTHGANIRIGLGCHLDPTTAVVRAVTELTQNLWLHRGRMYDQQVVGALDQSSEQWSRAVNISNNPQLVGEGRVAIAGSALARSDDLQITDRSLAILGERIRGVGLQAYFVDLTRQDIQIPCVRVIVPGLRPFWRRLAPGRLYDIPVRLKWVSEALSEEEMNPTTFILAR